MLITLNGPATPAPGVSDISLTVNQIVADYFPACIVLQMVRDQDGNPIRDLNASNVTVTEDGVPCVVHDVVEQAAATINVCLVLDHSGSMSGTATNDLNQAASTFVGMLSADDRAAVIDFDTTARTTQTFTSDKSSLLSAIQGASVGGGTALYDAAAEAISYTKSQGGRAAVILMTDGNENSSRIDLSTLLGRGTTAGIPVFTVGLNSWEGLNSEPLEQLAAATGGQYYETPTSSELEAIYQSISQQLAAQIQRWFTSPNTEANGATRNLTVRIVYGNLEAEGHYQYVH